MGDNSFKKQPVTIRIGRDSLSFSVLSGKDNDSVVFEPYVVKSGVSMAANLREAFKSVSLLQHAGSKVRVLLDTDVLMVPVELFEEKTMADMYNHAFTKKDQDLVYYNVIPDLNAVALFSMNRDLRLVIDDHFKEVTLIVAVSPVWRHLHQRSYTGPRNKLFGYFHEKKLEIFSFHQNRFKYCNSFEASRAQDSLYFLLYVWKQLQLKPTYDELHVVGDLPEPQWLIEQLRRYMQNVYIVNPSADFGKEFMAEVKGMPYDLQTLYAKGR